MKKAITQLSSGLIAITLGLALVSCGGNSDDSPPTVSGTITGVAATGEAISGGLVTLKCAGGLSSTTATTNADGSFSFKVSDINLPCLAQVSYNDSNGNLQTLHSYIARTGNTNITPMTDMLLALLLNTPAVSDAFNSFNSTPLKVLTPAEEMQALNLLRTKLMQIGITLPDGADPAHGLLIARTSTQAGNDLDLLLDDLQNTMQTNNITQFQLGLSITFGFPLDVAINFSPPSVPSIELLSLLASDIAWFGMAGSHEGVLASSDQPCSFSIDANGSISANFGPIYIPPILQQPNSPVADGLSISLTPPAPIPVQAIQFPELHDGQFSVNAWNYLELGSNYFTQSSMRDFFQNPGSYANSARSASLRHIVRATASETEAGAVDYFSHIELDIRIPTSSSESDGSATCITPEHPGRP